MPDGKMGCIDFGQLKRLPLKKRIEYAKLIVHLHAGCELEREKREAGGWEKLAESKRKEQGRCQSSHSGSGSSSGSSSTSWTSWLNPVSWFRGSGSISGRRGGAISAEEKKYLEFVGENVTYKDKEIGDGNVPPPVEFKSLNLAPEENEKSLVHGALPEMRLRTKLRKRHVPSGGEFEEGQVSGGGDESNPQDYARSILRDPSWLVGKFHWEKWGSNANSKSPKTFTGSKKPDSKTSDGKKPDSTTKSDSDSSAKTSSTKTSNQSPFPDFADSDAHIDEAGPVAQTSPQIRDLYELVNPHFEKVANILDDYFQAESLHGDPRIRIALLRLWMDSDPPEMIRGDVNIDECIHICEKIDNGNGVDSSLIMVNRAALMLRSICLELGIRVKLSDIWVIYCRKLLRENGEKDWADVEWS